MLNFVSLTLLAGSIGMVSAVPGIKRIYTDKECSGPVEENLGSRRDNAEACSAACIAEKGKNCKYFIFGQRGAALGNCWWEGSCSSTHRNSGYDVYQVLSVSGAIGTSKKIYTDQECSGPVEENLGSGRANAEACLAACIAEKGENCKYFIFGNRGAAVGNCWWEGSCSSTQYNSGYDVYQVLSATAWSNTRHSAWSNTDQQNCITKCMHDLMAPLRAANTGLGFFNFAYRLNRYHNHDGRCVEVCALESQNARG